ncbi:hypothetical protein M5K25_027433 [Dendrobium thyrsiflorum]|uniref:Uncharacterized protein n=1 Tax=Dendrobium thyrsiflorum TaxID=117978 RepID=A0ABD0TZU7_DENTH
MLERAGREKIGGGISPERRLKLKSMVRSRRREAIDEGMGPERKFPLRARKRREEQKDSVSGIRPMTRPGTSENSESAERRPMAASMRPESPGVPARGSPRARATTRSPSQKTPGKLQGSPVKSHREKKSEPGKSDSDFRIAWRERKSTG